MVEKDAKDKGKEKKSSNITPPFSDKQVVFLRMLLEERMSSLMADKGKGSAKKLTMKVEEPTNNTENSGEGYISRVKRELNEAVVCNKLQCHL